MSGTDWVYSASTEAISRLWAAVVSLDGELTCPPQPGTTPAPQFGKGSGRLYSGAGPRQPYSRWPHWRSFPAAQRGSVLHCTA